MKKRNIFTLLLCATALFALVGCNNNNGGGTEEPPVVETEEFTVTFNSNGGSQVSSQKIKKDEKVTKPTDPTREGYTFNGWFVDAACTTAWNFDNNTVTANTTLYAKWTKNAVAEVKYTVTFNSLGGSNVGTATVTEGNKVGKPNNPTRTDYIFGGWYKDAACTTAWNFETDTVNADITLYAKWTAVVKFTVTFDSLGGSSVAAATVNEGAKAVQPANPTKENHIFGGWYKDAACTTAWDFNTDTVTANTTLYAKWTERVADKTYFTVTFDSLGGSSVAGGELEEGSKLTAPGNPTKDGYTFVGWYKEATCTTAWDFNTDTVTANTTLYAKWELIKYTVTFDSLGGSSVASIEVEQYGLITAPTNPTKDGYTFDGWYTDSACTMYWNFAIREVESDMTLYAKWNAVQTGGDDQGGDNTGGDSDNTKPVVTVVYGNGQTNGTVELVYEDGDWYIDSLANPKKEYYDFVGWYTDPEGTNKFNTNNPVTKSVTLYAIYTIAYETVNTPFDYTAAVALVGSGNTHKLTEDTTFQNKFTLAKGSYVDGTFINTQGKSITFVLVGDNAKNKITFYASGASTTAPTEFVFYKVGDEANPIKTWSHKNKEGSTVTLDNLEAGTYVLTTSVSAKIESLSISEELQQSPTCGIEIATADAQINYLVGSDFSTKGLVLSLVYENNRKDNIDVASSISNSKLKVYLGDELVPETLTTPGVYTVKLVYNVSSTTAYEDNYEITVYAPVDIAIYDHTMDSQRITHVRQDVYAVGSTLDTTNLVVKAKCLKTGSTTEYIEFLLNSSEYTTSVDLSTAGRKEVTVSYKDYLQQTHTEAYSIEVVTLPNVSSLDTIEVTVDNTITAAVVDLTNGIKFATVNQAMQFLTLCNLADSVEKVVNLTAGQTYTEKVEITLPNLTLKTVGATAIENYAVITYNALNGILEPAETQGYSTDGSATVSIREEAVGFTAQNVYFKNYYNTIERFTASKEIAGDGTQAVACLVQADMSHFNACAFSSYQDTLYAQVGRQYYENCYIEGRTDYIFGEDATAYFTNCTIHSILGDSDNNGGYVATTKGSEGIIYNYIFDNCTFTAAEGVAEGSVSIARGWAENMKIVVMNSTLGAHLSKEAYGDTSSPKNDRYGKMNAAPVASQILEYNNTGAAAITASIANTCTVLTADNVKNYIDLNVSGNIVLSKVFTKDNGATKYSVSWAGPYIEENVTINIYNRLDEKIATYTEFAGNYFETPANLYEAGHHFVGWYTDQARTQEYSDTVALTDNQTLNLYAKYEGASSDHTFTFDIEPLKALADQDAIEQSHLTGNNAFLTRTSTSQGTVVYRKGYLEVSDTYIYYLEVKKQGLAVEFEGAGTITITFASTGSANYSRIGVVDENGVYAAGQIISEPEDTVLPTLVTTGDEAGSYEVLGTTYVTVKFTITNPGTYYIFVPTGVQNRATRVNSIVMVDNF